MTFEDFLKKCINTTPHAVSIVLPDGRKMVIPADTNFLIRVGMVRLPAGFLGEIPLEEVKMGELSPEDIKKLSILPEDTILIVSALVGQKLVGMVESGELVLPSGVRVVAPGELMRDKDGVVIGCKTLSVFI